MTSVPFDRARRASHRGPTGTEWAVVRIARPLRGSGPDRGRAGSGRRVPRPGDSRDGQRRQRPFIRLQPEDPAGGDDHSASSRICGTQWRHPVHPGRGAAGAPGAGRALRSPDRRGDRRTLSAPPPGCPDLAGRISPIGEQVRQARFARISTTASRSCPSPCGPLRAQPEATAEWAGCYAPHRRGGGQARSGAVPEPQPCSPLRMAGKSPPVGERGLPCRPPGRGPLADAGGVSADRRPRPGLPHRDPAASPSDGARAGARGRSCGAARRSLPLVNESGEIRPWPNWRRRPSVSPSRTTRGICRPFPAALASAAQLFTGN